MRILLIHAYFLPSGVAGSTRWNEMTRHLASAGHQITVLAGTVDYFTGKPYASLHEEPHHPNIRVVRASMGRTYNRGRWGRLWAYWTFFWASLRAGWLLRRESVDVVLASSPPLTVGLTGWLLARWFQKPFVLELRDLWPDAPIQLGYLRNRLLIGLARLLEGFLYRYADHIITLTPAFARVLSSQKRVASTRITTIPNGADLSTTQLALNHFDRAAFRTQNGLDSRFWIIYAGTHGPANGLGIVLEAAEALRYDPVGFLLLGDGPEKARLLAEVERRNLLNIRFLPALPKADALRWIAAADAGLVLMQPLPIFQTMLSAKLFDYLACGTPVLAAIDGQTRQLVEKQGLGLFVDPNVPDTWFDQISLYLARPSLVEKHSQNGLAYAHQLANRTNLSQQYLTLLNHVQQTHKTRS